MTNLERLLQLTSEELDFCSEMDRKFLTGKLAGLKLAQACRLTNTERDILNFVLNEDVSPVDGTDDLSLLVQKLREERRG